MIGKRLVQRCDTLDILNAVEHGAVGWHKQNRVDLTRKCYPYFDTVDEPMRRSMIRQVTVQLAKAEAQGYVQVVLDQVWLTVKGREYLRRLDSPPPKNDDQEDGDER